MGEVVDKNHIAAYEYIQGTSMMVLPLALLPATAAVADNAADAADAADNAVVAAVVVAAADIYADDYRHDAVFQDDPASVHHVLDYWALLFDCFLQKKDAWMSVSVRTR